MRVAHRRSVAADRAALPSLRVTALTVRHGPVVSPVAPALGTQLRYYTSRFARSQASNSSVDELRRAESYANAAPHDASAQNVYLNALLE